MIRNHSHYSLLMSTSRSKQIAKACKDAGYRYAGITDVATISGCVNFIQACKKEDITPLIGSEIILDDNSRLTLVCRNIEAWDDLLGVISRANSKDNHDGTPKISFADLTQSINPANFICIDGYVGSQLFSKLFPNMECIFDASDMEMVKSCIAEDWQMILDYENKRMSEIFPHYYLEINNLDSDTFPISQVMSQILSGYDNVIPDTSSYYPERKDAVDHRVLICTKLKTTMRQLADKIGNAKDIDLLKFIRSSSYHIKTREAIEAAYSSKQVENLDKITELCTDINILSKPKLPRFETPDGSTEDEYLKELCRHGWKRLITTGVDPYKYEMYKDRVLKELEVIQKADLAGYFLIVQDYVNHFRDQGCLVGPGRGSGGGSLVCYLTGITLIDPIEYGLIFERFYNEGRNTEDHVSLPDIDIDFPPSYRDKVVEYLKNKYGDSQVCQMLTFGRLAGRSILKEVLRVNESCSFDQMNKITEKIPNEAAISDLLEEMDNPSVIRWALENDRNSLIDYCWLDDDDTLQGEYAKVFEQAMRMEGIFKTQGKHAAGVVIASDDLTKICPMVKSSRSSEQIAGMEMGDLEAIGCVKFDILGVSLLEKISNTVEEINYELL
jgi:DNA polymerase III subunit alpha